MLQAEAPVAPSRRPAQQRPSASASTDYSSYAQIPAATGANTGEARPSASTPTGQSVSTGTEWWRPPGWQVKNLDGKPSSRVGKGRKPSRETSTTTGTRTREPSTSEAGTESQAVVDPEAEDEYSEGTSDDVYSESEYLATFQRDLTNSAAKVKLEDGVDLWDWE